MHFRWLYFATIVVVALGCGDAHPSSGTRSNDSNPDDAQPLPNKVLADNHELRELDDIFSNPPIDSGDLAIHEAAQAKADFTKLVELHRLSVSTDARSRSSLSPEQRTFIIDALDSRAEVPFAHDIPRMAAITVGNLRAGEAIPKLIVLLSIRLKNYSIVSEEAATALGKIGDPAALSPLFAALAGDRFSVRSRAARAIQQIATVDTKAIDKYRTQARFIEVLQVLSGIQFPTEGGERVGAGVFRPDPKWSLALHVDEVCGVALLVSPSTIGPTANTLAETVVNRLRKYFPKDYFSNPLFRNLARFVETFAAG